MSKRERTLLAVLAVLVLIALASYYFKNRGGSDTRTASSVDSAYEPIAVENPSLRLDLLAGLHKVEYKGQHRNIFSEIAPPPPKTTEEIRREAAAAAAPPPGPVVPAGPPPVFIDLKCYGYVEDPHTGARRAFFTNGDDVFIAGVGDSLENRLRVTHIGNDTVEVEEISSLRRTTIAIEQETNSP